MTGFDRKMKALADALGELGAGCVEIAGLAKDVAEEAKRLGAAEKMKNCVNCDHKDVCVVVVKRKAARANDYSPCENWKMEGAK